MDELEKNGEQPEVVQPSQEDNDLRSPSEPIEDGVEPTSEAERGVPIGKFKSVDDLYRAYNNLQAEFTRKSQKLADLEASTVTSQAEKKDSMLQSFFAKNPEAVFYADELKTRIENEQDSDSNALDRAWAGLLYEKLSSHDKAKEPIIQNLIKDDEIQDLVIKNYVKQLQEQKIPIVMSSNSGERVTKTATPKPDSFEEAKKVVLNLLS